jgi:hypothetical protein
LQSVRKLVSQDLLQSDHPEVTARALGELDDSGATRLLQIVEHCSQTSVERLKESVTQDEGEGQACSRRLNCTPIIAPSPHPF